MRGEAKLEILENKRRPPIPIDRFLSQLILNL
jgi:hypothetical protein